jgi:hypothetical protein
VTDPPLPLDPFEQGQLRTNLRVEFSNNHIAADTCTDITGKEWPPTGGTVDWRLHLRYAIQR